MEALVGQAADDLLVAEERFGTPEHRRQRQLEVHHLAVHVMNLRPSSKLGALRPVRRVIEGTQRRPDDPRPSDERIEPSVSSTIERWRRPVGLLRASLNRGARLRSALGGAGRSHRTPGSTAPACSNGAAGAPR